MPAQHDSDEPVNSEPDDDVMVERPEDDDYDLLTFGEAGARLSEEIIKLERRLAAMRSEDATAEQLAAAERRLEALREAAHRNRKPSLDELRASGFFGTTPER
jgi:hypothetical protein